MFKNGRCYVAIYIDDIIVIGGTYEECLTGTIKTIMFFLKLGFIIHPEKLTTFTRDNLSRICFQFKGNVSYTDHEKREKIRESCKSFFKRVLQ